MTKGKKNKKQGDESRRKMDELFLRMNEDIGRSAEVGLRKLNHQFNTQRSDNIKIR